MLATYFPSLWRCGLRSTPVEGRNPLGLRFLRRFRLARAVEGDRLANERLEGGLVNFFSFVDVDRAAYVSVEARVEETGRILQRRALGEGKLHESPGRVGRAGRTPETALHRLSVLHPGSAGRPSVTTSMTTTPAFSPV